jgi:lactoylglutathione lyase
MDQATDDAAERRAKFGFRLMHTMLRVRDLEKSVDFYTRILGMKLLFQQDYPDGRFSLAFVGYGDEWHETAIELTHNWDQDEPYTHGSGYGHIALQVASVHDSCAMLAEEGVSIPRPPGPMKHGTINIAFVDDPDGYPIELVQLPEK